MPHISEIQYGMDPDLAYCRGVFVTVLFNPRCSTTPFFSWIMQGQLSN